MPAVRALPMSVPYGALLADEFSLDGIVRVGGTRKRPSKKSQGYVVCRYGTHDAYPSWREDRPNEEGRTMYVLCASTRTPTRRSVRTAPKLRLGVSHRAVRTGPDLVRWTAAFGKRERQETGRSGRV